MIGQVLVGWLLADLMSGVMHIIGDSEKFGNSRIVKALAGKNTDHHADPLNIVSQSFIARNITTWIGTCVIGGALLLLFGPSWLLAAMVAGGLMISEVHRWAHSPLSAPAWARYMQRTGFFQSPKHHSTHHRPPYGVRFCLLTDYLNEPLDWLRARII